MLINFAFIKLVGNHSEFVSFYEKKNLLLDPKYCWMLM